MFYKTFLILGQKTQWKARKQIVVLEIFLSEWNKNYWSRKILKKKTNHNEKQLTQNCWNVWKKKKGKWPEVSLNTTKLETVKHQCVVGVEYNKNTRGKANTVRLAQGQM